MHLFLDTNIYLSFYHFTSDDLDELLKIEGLLANGAITLHVPQQVIREYERNREKKIADSRKELKDQRLSLSFPRLCASYPEMSEMRELQKKFAELHAALVAKIDSEAASNSLKPDGLVRSLLQSGTVIETSQAIFQAAHTRHLIGDPPGKKDSMGDAVNWESLLADVPPGQDLHFVARDGDYSSRLNVDDFHPVLAREWQTTKQSQIRYYRQLSSFFAEHFPNIVLSTEDEEQKDLLIQELAGSSSFFHTHQTVSKLSIYSDFTLGQRNAIVAAAIANEQVRWIATDSDVRHLLESVISGHEQEIEPNHLAMIKQILYPPLPELVSPPTV